MNKENAERIFELVLMTGQGFRKIASQFRTYPARKISPVIDRRPLKRITKQIIKEHNRAIMVQLGMQGILAGARLAQIQSQPKKNFEPGGIITSAEIEIVSMVTERLPEQEIRVIDLGGNDIYKDGSTKNFYWKAYEKENSKSVPGVD